LTDAVLLRGLRDSDELVRAAAVRLCEASMRARPLSDVVWTQLKPMPADHSLLVRYQLALSLGNINRPERLDVLTALLNADPGNEWVHFAAMSSLSSGGTHVLTALANNPAWRNDARSLAFLKELATMIGVQGHQDEAMALLDYLQYSRLDPRTTFTILTGFGTGLRQAGSSLQLIDPQNRLERLYTQAAGMTLNDSMAPDWRVAAIESRAVTLNPIYGIDDLSQLMLATQQPSNVLAATVATLGSMDMSEVFSGVLSQTGVLSPGQRKNVVSAMLRRGFRLHEALGSLEAGLLAPGDFNTAQLNLLRSFPDPSVSQHAVKLLGTYQPLRQEVAQQYAKAATIPGDANRGRALFAQKCASCHYVGGVGERVGPDLVARRSTGRQAILDAILQPSAGIAPHHNTAVIISKEGDVFMGVLRNEDDVSVTLVEPGGRAMVLPRPNIDRLQPEPWSLMPDGLEQGLNVQGVADIIEYVMTAPYVRRQ
jgi:putative heme-binding domain-containing protein